MIEYKFRAWDTLEKTMHEVAWLRFDNGHDLSNVGIYWNDDQHNGATRTEPPRSILMQYTGLKDKNNIEIYEGDILIWKPQKGFLPIGVSKGEVYWNEMQAGYWLRGKDNFDYSIDILIGQIVRISGNIYENRKYASKG